MRKNLSKNITFSVTESKKKKREHDEWRRTRDKVKIYDIWWDERERKSEKIAK